MVTGQSFTPQPKGKTNNMKWINVKFEFDNYKTIMVRHKRYGKVLRQYREFTGETSTCQTSIPESEKDNALNYINTHDDYKQFRGANPRNLIIT